MLDYIIRQFGHPRGPVGTLAGFIMATRPSNRARNAWAVSLLNAAESTRILEIGCGPGLALEQLCRTAQQAHLVGVDHSALMVGYARRRIASCIAAGRAEVRVAHAAHLPFPPAQFDRILAVNSFAFWRGVPGAVERVFRLLTPAGRFVIVHQPRGPGATDAATRRFEAETTTLLARIGFRIVHTEFLPLSPIVAGIVAERP